MDPNFFDDEHQEDSNETNPINIDENNINEDEKDTPTKEEEIVRFFFFLILGL